MRPETALRKLREHLTLTGQTSAMPLLDEVEAALVDTPKPFPYQDNCATLAEVSAGIDARETATLTPDEAQQAHKLGMA